jgi:hypothetical protein
MFSLQNVQRYDSGRLGKATSTPTGGARIPALVSRTGVQSYRLADGSTRKEYRSPEEVFHPEALASFVGAAVTIGHPPRRVGPDTWAKDSVGFVLSQPDRVREVDGHEYASVLLDVNRGDALARVSSGDLVENSLGYTCDFDPTPGIDPVSGENFDGYQRNIRVNHSALLGEGKARAGRKARLLTDDNNCLRLDADGNQTDAESTMKFILAGKEYEAGPELQAAIGAQEAQLAASVVSVTAAQTAAGEAQAKADAAEKSKTDALAKVSPEAIDALVADELAFRASVAPILGAEFVFAGKSRKDVKLAVVESVKGEKLATDAADGFIDGYFAVSLKDASKPKADSSESYRAPVPATKNDSAPADEKLYLNDDLWAAHMASLHSKKDSE